MRPSVAIWYSSGPPSVPRIRPVNAGAPERAGDALPPVVGEEPLPPTEPEPSLSVDPSHAPDVPVVSASRNRRRSNPSLVRPSSVRHGSLRPISQRLDAERPRPVSRDDLRRIQNSHRPPTLSSTTLDYDQLQRANMARLAHYITPPQALCQLVL